ncbi:MAG: hypothetical protein Q9M97_00655 [Candidatus Gracilibacteria bacterium]|nr:hypothetical protein [Candidatus Gracilibacteria bacterium]
MRNFLYRLIRQLHNIISGNSENYKLWSELKDDSFKNCLNVNKEIFNKLKRVDG